MNSEEEKYIVKTPELDFQPDSGGMGWEIFKCMKKFKTNIGQIDSESGEKETYTDILKRCVRTAIAMQKYDVKNDDVICLCSNNHLNSCVPYIATLFLGAKICALDPSMSVKDMTYLLKQVNLKIIFVIPSVELLVETCLREAGVSAKIVVFGKSQHNLDFDQFLKPSREEFDFVPKTVENVRDAAVILFSSGTTGFPKGICLNHIAIVSQSANILKTGAITSVSLGYATLYWISAVLILLASIMSGNARLVCPRFDPVKFWKFIDKYKVSFIMLAPSHAVEVYKSGRPLDVNTTSLLELIVGGAVFAPNHLMKLRNVLPGTNVSQVYGQTEVSGVFSIFRANDKNDNMFLLTKLESSGRPLDGFWCKIVDPQTGKIKKTGERGELYIKSEFVMNGYYNKDSNDAWDSDGWLKTGDIAYFDKDNFLYIVDRIKEMLKFRSWHIAPAILESVIGLHSAVRTSIVIGIPHSEDGDHPMACVILNENAGQVTPKEIEKFVEERVDDRQRLRGGVKFIDKIPTTPTGKVRRRELRDLVLKGKI